MVQVYEVNRKLLQEHAAPLMAVYLHGVAVVRQELNMDVGGKTIKGVTKLLCLVTLKTCISCIAAVMPHRTSKTSRGVSNFLEGDSVPLLLALYTFGNRMATWVRDSRPAAAPALQALLSALSGLH